MNKLNGYVLLLLIVSIFTYGLFEWKKTPSTSYSFVDQEETPDFIAESLKSNIYNKDGNLSHAIEADRMEHYSALALTRFELPFYTIYPRNNEKPWKLSAKKATLYKNNRVILNNRVHLVATEKDSLIQEIHCKYLELDLNTNIISSDQTVLIIGKNFTTYGSGLIIDLNTKQMTLTEHVRTIIKKSDA